MKKGIPAQQSLSLQICGKIPVFIQLIIRKNRSDVGAQFESLCVQIIEKLLAVWKLDLAVGERSIVVLKVDVDV